MLLESDVEIDKTRSAVDQIRAQDEASRAATGQEMAARGSSWRNKLGCQPLKESPSVFGAYQTNGCKIESLRVGSSRIRLQYNTKYARQCDRLQILQKWWYELPCANGRRALQHVIVINIESRLQAGVKRSDGVSLQFWKAHQGA